MNGRIMKDSTKINKPMIIAHRGARTEAPENTKSAYDKALSYGVDGFEFDVRMSKDGKAVVYHDKTLHKINRTRKRIADHTYEELCKFDWGAWFSPEYQNEPILTLNKTLSLYAHRCKLMIEIKSDPGDRKSGRHLELTDLVLKELDKTNVRQHIDNIYILSFDAEVLKHAYRKMLKIRYVLNLSEDDSPTSFGNILTQPLSEINYLHALCVNQKYLSSELVEFCRKLKKQIMIYPCNTLKQLNRVLALTSDVVMTDKPGWLADIIGKIRHCPESVSS